jgi:hypothetical protein
MRPSSGCCYVHVTECAQCAQVVAAAMRMSLSVPKGFSTAASLQLVKSIIFDFLAVWGGLS